MIPQEAIPILERLQEPEAWEPQISRDAFEALELAIEALEDREQIFHLECLRCKKPVGTYSRQTMEQVSYTHYSYCEDCLRKGLKMLKKQDALDKQSASTEQADYKAQVKILADVLDSCPLTEPCDWMWRPTGWCKDHCKDGQDSPDAECWLEYARVMAESKTESDHIADSDKMVDQFRGITKKTDDVSISKQEVLTNIRKLCDGCYLMEHCGQCNPECRLRQAIDMIEESSSVPMIPKKPSENGESEMNSMDEWWKNYIRSRMSQDDRLE